MKILIVIAGLLFCCGCSSKKNRPSVAELTGKPVEQQCQMVASRIRPCINALITEKARTIKDTEGSSWEKIGDVIKEELDKKDRELPPQPQQTDREAIQICKLDCIGNPDFVFRVLHCWDRKDCADFSACIYRPAQ